MRGQGGLRFKRSATMVAISIAVEASSKMGARSPTQTRAAFSSSSSTLASRPPVGDINERQARYEKKDRSRLRHI
jgi:hypothetical protein